MLLRLKADHDGAEPAGSSVAAYTLLRLAELLGRDEWKERAEATLRAFSGTLRDAPHALPGMLAALDLALEGPVSVVVIGPKGDARTTVLLDAALAGFVPRRVVDDESRALLGPRLPWTAGMGPIEGQPAAHVCRNRACDQPTVDPQALRAVLAPRSLR